MKAEKALVAMLAADATLVAAIGAKTFPGIAPQGTDLPYVRYSVVSTQRVRGAFTDPGLAQVLFQIMCFGDGYLAAKTIADKVRAALERKSGTYATSVVVQDVWFENETDAIDPELQQPYVVAEYRMILKET